MKLQPKVSVSMITYDHEKFIEEAINGVLMQECDFDFELIISNDCSPDNTDAVIQKILQNHPKASCITYFNHKKNLGMMPNSTFALQQCTGKYIAACEGDDYWIDPYKLQKQVDFLEANPDYVLSFHKIKILKSDGSLISDFITKVPENYETQETLARLGNYIHTPSIVFRNIIKEYPKELSISPIGDYFLYMILTEHGKIKYLEDEMAVYRYGVGVISKMDDFMIACNNIKMYSCMIGAIKNVDVKSILMKRQDMIIEQYGKSFERKTIDTFKFWEIITYTKKKILKIIFNPKKSLSKFRLKFFK
jgi:glycosyltransferase involved in cell wall biosynthesis